MKAINCDPNLYFQSSLLFITDYLQFPFLLTLQFWDHCNVFKLSTFYFLAKKCNITGRVNTVDHPSTAYNRFKSKLVSSQFVDTKNSLFRKQIKSSSSCKIHITGHEYLIILNRGGLTILSANLVNYDL